MIKDVLSGAMLFALLVTSLPCEGQELAAKLIFDRSDATLSKDLGMKEFVFHISGASAHVISNELRSILDSREEILEYTLEKKTDLLYRGYIMSQMALGSIDMVGMMMMSGVTHVQLNGKTIPIKELRKQIRERQAKTH